MCCRSGVKATNEYTIPPLTRNNPNTPKITFKGVSLMLKRS